MNIGTGCDMICCYCGRPVLGTMVWGESGPYHYECCQPLPAIRHTTGWGETNPILADLLRRIEKLEQKADTANSIHQ